ncbi:MAG: hypothetical protein Q9208_004972 [Pyrenodesmia sp. 3 TL-2023]
MFVLPVVSPEETMFAGWKNPFATKSILEFADSFIALQADYIVPHILPGATSTGRPYIVDNATYFANLTSVQFTRASLPNLSSLPNMTYPAVLSGFTQAAPAGHVINAAAWYGCLAGFVASVLLFVILAWSNQSIRAANNALSVAVSQTDRLFSGLLGLTSRSDPDMSEHLREFLQAAQQQGWIPDPYKLDLMAHVELIIGLDGQVTLLTFRNDDLAKKYDATLNENLNLRQALALYQDRCEKRDREAIYLQMTVDRLNASLSSQSRSHADKVDQLAKGYSMTETTNTKQLSKLHLELVKNLQSDHENDMKRQAQQLSERYAKKIQSLRDDHKNDMDGQAHQLRDKLRKAEERLARAIVPIEIRALPLPASDDTDLGDPAGALYNSDHEKVHTAGPVDHPVRVKKPTRRRTHAQVEASKRRQQQAHSADGEREATSKAAAARTYDPTGDDQQAPREEVQKPALPESSSHPSESVGVGKEQFSATQDSPRGESCEPVSQTETEVETPQTEPGNYLQQEEKKKGKNHNKNVRKRQNDKARKEAEKAEKARLEAESSTANTELKDADSHLTDGLDHTMVLPKNTLQPEDAGQAQTESTSTPALDPSLASASVTDVTADSKSPSTDTPSFNPGHEPSSSVPRTASPSPLSSLARPKSAPSTEQEENTDADGSASYSTVDEENDNEAKAGSRKKLRRRRTNNPETKAAQNRRKMEKRKEKKVNAEREKGQEGTEDATTTHKHSDEQSAPTSAGDNLAEDDHSAAPDEDTTQSEQAPTSVDAKKSNLAANQAAATSEPGEERSGLDAAASGADAESQDSSTPASSHQQQTSDEALPSSVQSSPPASSQQQQTSGEALPSCIKSSPPSAPNPGSDGVQGLHGEGFGRKDRKPPSQNWISYAEWKKAEKEKEEKEQAEIKKDQAQKRSADPAPTPASRPSSVGGAREDRPASTSTHTPAAGHQQGFTQPLARREHRDGGQATEGSNQQAPRGMRLTGNDPGAAFRREFYRHVGRPEDGPGVSSGPPSEPFIQPQPPAPKPRQNKGRGQGARQRRKWENEQRLGNSGAY